MPISPWNGVANPFERMSMISIRKYLEASSAAKSETTDSRPAAPRAKASGNGNLLPAMLSAWSSALDEIGRSSAEACPATSQELVRQLAEVGRKLADTLCPASIAEAEAATCASLHDWGRSSAKHYQQKAAEIKEMLLAMARTAESVGDRDQRCARQIDDVTNQLRRIASLDDISQIRTSIQKSAVELKTSIDRLNAEGKAALDALQEKVTTFQTKLEEAEHTASLDALTRLRSRLWVEGEIELRIGRTADFCIAILDIDGFKSINDTHGHVVGDEILRQFSNELRSACRLTDIVGRWGGDEFLVVIDRPLSDAEAQMERARGWVCGNYTVEGSAGTLRIRVDASCGLAAYTPAETLESLLGRADAAMYQQKAAARAGVLCASGK